MITSKDLKMEIICNKCNKKYKITTFFGFGSKQTNDLVFNIELNIKCPYCEEIISRNGIDFLQWFDGYEIK